MEEKKEASGPLAGFKVVELAMWAAGPMVGGILADWGADIIKIEPADGDPFRALNPRPGKEIVTESSIEFLVNNRAKRSIVLDVRTEEGRAIALELIHKADVFLTNLRSNALERMRLDYETLHELEPGLVYCHVTGYGSAGEWRDRAAYDVGAFYARAGVAATLLPPGDEPMMRCGAFGDYYTAMSAAGGVCAALIARQKTGRGQRVLTSLLRTGAYAISAHLDRVAQGSPPRAVKSRAEILNPMINCYRDSRGKWFWLLGLQGDRLWPGVTRAIGRPELENDPRFNSLQARGENSSELTPILDRAFAGRPLEEWEPIFEREDIWWTPVNNGEDLLKDKQMIAAGGLTALPTVNLVRLSERIDFVEAASMGCRFVYHGILDQGQVKADETVVIYGCGGVGLSATQIAASLGARVIAIDLDDRQTRIGQEGGRGTSHQRQKHRPGASGDGPDARRSQR